MKKPIAVLLTDTHLKDTNIELVKSIFQQAINYAKQNGADVFHLGDLFDSRKAQKMTTLVAFNEILDLFAAAGKRLYIIPGNHDKTEYTSEMSFLSPFKFHPNISLIETVGRVRAGNIYFHMVPFFDEKTTYSNYLKQVLLQEGTNILLTHVAISGVKNNDGSIVESDMNTGTFAKFDKVFVGHYHDPQQVGADIFYIGSTHQNNFGENYEKGFTVVYDDITHELIKTDFPKFSTFVFDAEDKGFETVLDEYTAKYTNGGENVRFVLQGAANALKSLKIDYLKAAGIDVKIEEKEIQEKAVEKGQFKEYNDDTIRDAFKEFCEAEGLEYKEVEKFLN